MVVVVKRGSRHAAHAAKALQWRIEQLLPYKEKNSLVVMLALCLDPTLVVVE